MPSGVTLREYAALLYPTGSMTCEIRSLAAVGAVTEPESWTTNHPKSRERGSRARRAVLRQCSCLAAVGSMCSFTAMAKWPVTSQRCVLESQLTTTSMVPTL